MGKYKRKTNRANICEEKMMSALRDIQEKKITFREASTLYDIPKMTIFNRMKKAKAEMRSLDNQSIIPQMGLKNQQKSGKYASHQIFTTAQESILVQYLLTCSKLNYGLTMDDMRDLAYRYSVSLARKCPESWKKNQRAGQTWAKGFLKRNTELSLRKPENTSLARNTSFNRENLTIFFENMQEIMRQHSFEPSKIWNLDETGLSTVLQAPRVLAASSAKQVGQCVSNERGEKVSIVGIVNAAGESLPPVYIFPRKRVHPEYMEGSPSGSIALFNATGYMDSEGFVRTLEHIKLKTAPSKENPILIVLDNHGSHLSLAAIRMCRESGIHMVTLPPHTSHRTQPLDLTVFGPFKSYCKKAFNAWLTGNPGQRITLHNVARISADAINKSFSSKNIQSGFAKSGVYPLDRSRIFGDLEALEESVAPVAPISVSSPAVSTDHQEMISMDFSVEAHAVGIRNSGLTTPVNQLDDETLLDLSDEVHVLVGDHIPASASPLNNFVDTGTILESSDEVQMPVDLHLSTPLPTLNHFNDAGSSREFSDETLLGFQRPTSPWTQPLDLSVTSPDIHSGRNVQAVLPKRIYPLAHSLLDLSVKSLTSPATCPVPHSQLRFAGLEVLRPIPNPLAFQTNSKFSRGMTSTIVTGSPELKRKEELEVKKALKKEKLEVKKQSLEVKKALKKEKLEAKKQSLEVKKALKKEKLEAKKALKENLEVKNEVKKKEPNQRKRGRPRKIPLSEPINKQ